MPERGFSKGLQPDSANQPEMHLHGARLLPFPLNIPDRTVGCQVALADRRAGRVE